MKVANGDWRTPEVLQLQRLREAREEALAAAEDDRRHDDRQLVDEAFLERLQAVMPARTFVIGSHLSESRKPSGVKTGLAAEAHRPRPTSRRRAAAPRRA
jgi:hypothetical protein